MANLGTLEKQEYLKVYGLSLCYVGDSLMWLRVTLNEVLKDKT